MFQEGERTAISWRSMKSVGARATHTRQQTGITHCEVLADFVLAAGTPDGHGVGWDVRHWLPSGGDALRGQRPTCRHAYCLGRQTAGTQAPRRSCSQSGRLAARYFWPGLSTTVIAMRARPAPWDPSPLIV